MELVGQAKVQMALVQFRTSCRAWCRPALGPSGTICRRSLRRSRCTVAAMRLP